MKKVNLVISRKFPAQHPRTGQTTGLIEKLLKGAKIHTIRDNIDYWEEKVARVNAGEMFISAKSGSIDRTTPHSRRCAGSQRPGSRRSK